MENDGELFFCRDCSSSKSRDCFPKNAARKSGLYPYCRPCSVKRAQRQYDDPTYRDRKREYDRARAARLADKLSAQAKVRYEADRSAKIRAARDWALANPEKRRTVSQHYKHRRRAQEKSGMTYSALERWKLEQPKICHWCDCDCSSGYVADHYVPLAKGGRHEANNLVIACRSCNARKSAKDPEAFAREIGKLHDANRRIV